MNRFEQCSVITDVGARRDAETPDQSGTEIRENIAIQIGENDHIVELRLLHQLHAHVVDQPLFILDAGDILATSRATVIKQTVGAFPF